MKAQRRHDLKTNTLSEQLAASVDWIKKNTTYFTAGVVLTAVLVGGGWWYRYNKGAVAQQGWLDLAASTFLPAPRTAPEEPGERISRLRQLAATHGNGSLAAAAWNELGDALTGQALVQQEDEPQQAVGSWEQAAQAYEAAIRAAQDNPELTAAGHVGAAIANESLVILAGKTDGFDVAQTHYAAVVDDERLAGSPVQALASKRQTQLGGLREPVVFAPASRPATQSAGPRPARISASRPAVELAPRPTTKSAPGPASRSAPSGK